MLGRKMEYCVAIRTLGKAGDKYQQELDSLLRQTIPPKHIFVYIPESYPLPKETVGVEEYIRCQKGMVAQRALRFEEVDTPYCLFLDDDVSLAPDAAEKLLSALVTEDADCVAADTFKNQDMSFALKFKSLLTTWAMPMKSKYWAFKITKSCSFKYNARPSKEYYYSQSAAGPCSLWRMESFRNIHFEDEVWMDKQRFAYGEDLILFHKLYRNGGLLLVHYDSGVNHLDARSSRQEYETDYSRFYVRSFFLWSIWKRTQFDAKDLNLKDKFLSLIVIIMRFFWEGLLLSFLSLSRFSILPICYSFRGFIAGIKFTVSDNYHEINNYIVNL